MSTIYAMLRCKKGAQYRDDVIVDHSMLRIMPAIDKPDGALAGNSRIIGDASADVQDRVIDIIVEIGARYKLSYRDIAYVLLMCKIESGFNPDAAAGTTSAAGLGQYTKDTIIEAAKDNISKKRLGFTLDLAGAKVFDAERGAYGVVLSYMFSKERAAKQFGTDVELGTYIHHHEGWYFKKTPERMESKNVEDVIALIKQHILPQLSPLEKLLAQKTSVSFKLLTKDDKPYADQPYVAIHPPAASAKQPGAVQAAAKKPVFVVGRTDGEGKTKPVETAGLTEVLFVILNRDYKSFIDVNRNEATNVHTVKSGETLAKIAKQEGTSVAELQKLNHITDANKIAVGQSLTLHTGQYLWRRPPMTLIAEYLADALNMNAAAAPAVVEHKRSHIVLPTGNAAQTHGTDKNVIAIRGNATLALVAERKKVEDIPHKTVEKKIVKPVVLAPAASGKVLREGLLFPLPARSKETYHTGARRFKSSRGKRLHAGCDLYAPVGTDIKAMADGIVLNCYSFYWETDAIEVQHGDFIVRYGEVAPMSKKERERLKGKDVKRGEVIGQIGQLIQPSGKKYKDTMLHLEMYSTNKSPATAPLTNQSAPFRRRSDLVDPTPTIDKCLAT